MEIARFPKSVKRTRSLIAMTNAALQVGWEIPCAMPRWNAKPSTGTTETAPFPVNPPVQSWSVAMMAAEAPVESVKKVPPVKRDSVSPHAFPNVKDWNVGPTDVKANAVCARKAPPVQMASVSHPAFLNVMGWNAVPMDVKANVAFVEKKANAPRDCVLR